MFVNTDLAFIHAFYILFFNLNNLLIFFYLISIQYSSLWDFGLSRIQYDSSEIMLLENNKLTIIRFNNISCKWRLVYVAHSRTNKKWIVVDIKIGYY